MQCVECRRKTQLLGRGIIMKRILLRTAFLGRYNAESLILLYATYFKSSLMYCECIFCTAY